MKIIVSPTFRNICPRFKGGAILATIKNSKTSAELWDEIENECQLLACSFTTDSIKQRSGIAATREAYRKAGKDPSRYRPACEQLARRVLQGKELYSIDTIVDLGNLVSLSSGYATAMVDYDKIDGTELTLRLGRSDDDYEGIGRGTLNIESLPVYCDSISGIATPTSDSVRTMIGLDTRRLLMLINAYDGDIDNLNSAISRAVSLLIHYGKAQDVRHFIYE